MLIQPLQWDCNRGLIVALSSKVAGESSTMVDLPAISEESICGMDPITVIMHDINHKTPSVEFLSPHFLW